MFVDSFVISIAVFCYFFFDCGYPEVAIYCFVGNIPECIYKGSQRFRLISIHVIMVLQSVILFHVLRLERRPVSQQNFLNLSLSCFDLFVMCCFHVSLLSRVMPRYLTESLLGIVILLMIISWGQVCFRSVKVTCVDLFSLILKLHL